VKIQGLKIATTFWGKAWCENLESYSDYSNRLPRGRTYVRNGSVVDLQIEAGRVTAVVSGSEPVRRQDHHQDAGRQNLVLPEERMRREDRLTRRIVARPCCHRV